MSTLPSSSRVLHLVDFLGLLLEAHASALNRLTLKFGIEHLIELLEGVEEVETIGGHIQIPLEIFGPDRTGQLGFPPGAVYQRLEGTVHSAGLNAQLEFYVWAYPLYRALIEGPFPLDRPIANVDALIDIAVAEASAWLKTLPLNTVGLLAAEQVIQVPWVQFRAQVLEKSGRRRLGAV